MELQHKYKIILLEYLKNHYDGRGWKISTAFCRDEINFTLPIQSDPKVEMDLLYSVLETLPYIDEPEKRVRFVFWLENDLLSNCQIELINPSKVDLAIAISPEFSLSIESYKIWHVSNDDGYLQKYHPCLLK